MGWKHRVTNADPDKLVGDCEYCGPGVRLMIEPQANKIRCWAGRQKGGTYGEHELTYEQKLELFGDQSECPVCKKPLTYHDSHLDHDHVSGELRGFICSSCNLGLGKLGDTVVSIQSALDYLVNPPLGEKYGQQG